MLAQKDPFVALFSESKKHNPLVQKQETKKATGTECITDATKDKGAVYTWSLHAFSLIGYLSDLLKRFHLHLFT